MFYCYLCIANFHYTYLHVLDLDPSATNPEQWNTHEDSYFIMQTITCHLNILTHLKILLHSKLHCSL